MDIDLSRDALITPFGRDTLQDRYLLPTESSPQEAFARACTAFADDAAHAQRLYDYVSNHWFMFATPLLSNGGTQRGLPISCFLNYVPDSRGGILGHYAECGWLSSVGGGIGAYYGDIRSNGQPTRHGSQSSGLIPFIKPVDALVLAFSQGIARRGSYAAYTDLSHPEIEEFIGMRKPQGGDPNRKTLNLHHGVMVPDSFMQIIERCMKDKTADDSWPLIDPHTQQAVKTISARALWRSILETRIETGEPYLVFSDTVNRAFPEEQKALGLSCRNSNLCTEITLATGPDQYGRNRTAVCCLSSVNIAKYDEWGGSACELFVDDLLRMLDNTLDVFIRDAPPALEDAVYSAGRERSVGLGAMGFHSFLQSHDYAMDSSQAELWNEIIFRRLKTFADRTNHTLAIERGACPDSIDGGDGTKRFMHCLAIAPNASSSLICGEVSPGIEPIRANAYTAKTLSGSALIKNPYLARKLEALGKNTDAVWTDIITHRGSVQHLNFLGPVTQQVFRTAMEIDQITVVRLAAQRAKFIDQASSTNLFFAANSSVQQVFQTHMAAWRMGVKSLYYCRSEGVRAAEHVSIKPQEAPAKEVTDIATLTDESCQVCSG